ncbi:uncharacterized protein LOC111784490 [Cucurbita pepo subsp. pepo]|uniref:uncharacterized protein LOC111784490 n=1 Tax=Cucurbita pepo subsp. pepo TaxID=3664 RepID=UPI000C9D5749|nr:uncharacterized protein LOC111784490 [Cucurbita pepo subsp. pepo]
MKMKVYLRAQGVWDAIESTEPLDSLDERKDQMTLAAIYQAIPEEMLFLLAEKEAAKEAWKTLKTIHVSAERVKEAKIQTLKIEFEIMKMKESETIDDYAARLIEVVNKIRTFGDKFEEAYLVKKFIRSVPSKFLHIVSAIEKFADLKVMTMEEVIGEERIGGNKENAEHVLLTQGEWKEKKRSDNGGHSRGRGRSGRWRGRGHGRGNDSFHQEKKADKSKVRCYNCQGLGHYASECRKLKCYNCQKIGHYASDCRSKKRENHYASHCRSKKRENQAHLTETQSDEDEPALLTAQVCEVRTLGLPELTEMALYEEKVVSKEIEKKNNIWFLDTEASNHMTGYRSWFSELNELVTGTVKFGDGSLVEIKERGDVKAASVKKTEKMINEEKIDGPVKIESKKKNREARREEERWRENRWRCEVAGETKAEKEKEKEAIVSGSAIEVPQGTKPIVEQQLAGLVEQVIKPIEEKPLAGQVEQVIKTVDEKQLPIERKTEKNEGGDNGSNFHPLKRSILRNEEKIDGPVKIESKKKNREARREEERWRENRWRCEVAGETKAEKEKEKEAIVSGSAIEVPQGTKPIVEQQLAGLVEQVIKPIEEKPLAGQVEQVAGETKAEKEKEKEAIVSGSAIEVPQGTKPIVEQQLAGLVEQVIKPIEEKPLAGQVEQVIKTVDEKQLPIERKTEKNEGGDNGSNFHPLKRSILR